MRLTAYNHRTPLARILAGLFLLLLAAAPCRAAENQATMTVEAQPPWQISADTISTLQGEQVYLAEGQVRLKRGPDLIEADRIRLDDESRTAEASGNVVFTSADVKVVCQRLISIWTSTSASSMPARYFSRPSLLHIGETKSKRPGPTPSI
jgi:lipopolysaccharide assembly outer membrane protein LptD (OstA)